MRAALPARAAALAGLVAIGPSAGCAPREVLYPLIGQPAPRLRDFPPEFEAPYAPQTGAPVTGWGGDGGGVWRTPVIFVHGNTVGPAFWLPARRHFKEAGYTGDELWALGYGWESTRAFDGNDQAVPALDAFVRAVQVALQKKTGRRIEQFDIVAHSLGVTVVRQWMRQTNSYHRVRSFIAVAGANHGAATALPDARGQNRISAFELFAGSPWLAQLNRGGETPGAVRYMTLYDGTGWNDVLFPAPLQDSPRLDGAVNLAFDRDRGAWFDHLELPRVAPTMDAMIEFLRGGSQPRPGALPPQIVRVNDRLVSDQPQARLYCSGRGLPTLTNAPARTSLELTGAQLQTCFAHNPDSGLAGPLLRYQPRGAAPPSAAALTLSAEPPAGAYEQPVKVRLAASEPGAWIVYSTAGLPDSGASLYEEPVYVPGPLVLTAVAHSADGRQSQPLRLEYDISLELIEARHSLQRQFDPQLP